LNITVQLYPPLKFAGGTEYQQLEVTEGLSIGDLLKRLEAEGAFGDYKRQAVIAMVENDVAFKDYILKPEQVVKILLALSGG
jgi:sulfur carrier protein ThiS